MDWYGKSQKNGIIFNKKVEKRGKRDKAILEKKWKNNALHIHHNGNGVCLCVIRGCPRIWSIKAGWGVQKLNQGFAVKFFLWILVEISGRGKNRRSGGTDSPDLRAKNWKKSFKKKRCLSPTEFVIGGFECINHGKWTG